MYIIMCIYIHTYIWGDFHEGIYRFWIFLKSIDSPQRMEFPVRKSNKSHTRQPGCGTEHGARAHLEISANRLLAHTVNWVKLALLYGK